MGSVKPHQPGVSILQCSRVDDVVTTELCLKEGSWPAAPLAPATVWGGEDDRERVIDLHRLVSLREDAATFESYGIGEVQVSSGDEVRHAFYSWWTPEQLEVARDRGLAWRRRAYDGADHDHCLLTWQKIQPRDVAYVSEAGWLSVEAYEQFIRDDRLRLRRSQEGRTE
jgi:hypothetical protein